ncbi:MAG: TolB family protein [Candidatus Kapaibacteriales bacterium]
MQFRLTFFLFFLPFILLSQIEGKFVRNAGRLINTHADEFPIDFDGTNFVFLRKDGNNQTLFHCKFYDDSLTSIEKYFLPHEFRKYNIFSLTSFTFSNRKEIIFSATLPKKFDSDLFIAVYDLDEGRYKIQPFPYNTKDFESQPRFAPDGSYIVYVSDVKGSRGGTDLMISFREESNNGWSRPIFLDSSINTTENEMSPFLDKNGNLFFSRYVDGNYEIFKAQSKGQVSWHFPQKLALVNASQSNEIFPMIINDKLFFASNRREGNGGFDIWYTDLCLPVLLEVNFTELSSIFSSYNKLLVQDENGLLVEEKYLGIETQMVFKLLPEKTYNILIANECNNKKYFERRITTPCSDSTIFKYLITMKIGNVLTKDFQVPFFVTGYYKPNTSPNLASLRKLFDYKLIGYDDSTRFVEYPGSIYDSLAVEVDSAMNTIVNSIKYFLALFRKNCLPSWKRLLIQITGYADPRPISENARFFEQTIDDQTMNTFIRRGSKIDNFLLSKLRAYFTAKLIENELRKDSVGEYDLSSLIWEIRGGGESSFAQNDNFLHLRKVQVIINIIDLN